MLWIGEVVILIVAVGFLRHTVWRLGSLFNNESPSKSKFGLWILQHFTRVTGDANCHARFGFLSTAVGWWFFICLFHRLGCSSLWGESLSKCGLERLDDRRDMITQSTFRQIKDPKHPLHYLLPPVKVSHSQMVLRPTYPYQIPLAKTSRCGRDFVPYCISKKF